jgi:hypothetical protein
MEASKGETMVEWRPKKPFVSFTSNWILIDTESGVSLPPKKKEEECCLTLKSCRGRDPREAHSLRLKRYPLHHVCFNSLFLVGEKTMEETSRKSKIWIFFPRLLLFLILNMLNFSLLTWYLQICFLLVYLCINSLFSLFGLII